MCRTDQTQLADANANTTVTQDIVSKVERPDVERPDVDKLERSNADKVEGPDVSKRLGLPMLTRLRGPMLARLGLPMLTRLRGPIFTKSVVLIFGLEISFRYWPKLYIYSHNCNYIAIIKYLVT